MSPGLPPVRGSARRVAVMGVLNVTPDSFSDGGRWAQPGPAIAHGLALWADGADIVDVGGESTRPGARQIGAEAEAARVLPVIAGLVAAGVTVSVDTYRAEVAAAALQAGASTVNDVSGGLADPNMLAVVRDAGCPYVIMHWRGPSADMDRLAVYDDVVADVRRELQARVDAAVDIGVDPGALVLDPGLGFAKRAEHNWTVLAGIDQLIDLGLPVLVGGSRKKFLGELLAEDGGPRPPGQRESATTAITTYLAEAGVWGVRVHDARAAVDAGSTVAAIAAARAERAARAGRAKRAGVETDHDDPRRLPTPGRSGVRAADRISLLGLREFGYHGVLPTEREHGQVFVVDAEIELDLGQAARSDDVQHSVHYGELAAALAAVVTGAPVNLLETLAGRLADVCLSSPRVTAATVTVHKPDAPIAQAFADVSVRIRRTRADRVAAPE